MEFGDHAGAEALFADLVRRAENSFGAGNSRTEYCRLMAGEAAYMLNDTATAALYLTRARKELAGKPIDPNHVANQIERFYSMLLIQRGDLAGAKRAVAEGLARERAMPQPVLVVLVDLLDAQVTAQMASFDSLGLDSTLHELEQRFGEGSRTQGVYLGDYLRAKARAEEWRGRHDLAREFALRSEAYDRARLQRNVRALPDRRALQMAGELGDPLDLLLALSSTGGEPAISSAWDRLVRRRGLATAELSRRRAPRAASGDTALAAAHARWVQAARRFARLDVADAGASPAREESRAEAERAEHHYATLAHEHGVVSDTTTVDFARVRAALAPDQALVSLATIAARSDTGHVIAFTTVGPRGRLERADLGRSGTLVASISAWRAALEAPPARGSEHARELACRRLGMRVRARTWDRLVPKIAGAHRVTLVADGALADLPWQALPTAVDRYLVETGPEISTPDAERELLVAPSGAGRGLLALGDPDFDAADVHPVTLPAHPDTSARLAAASRPSDTFAASWEERLRGLSPDCGGPPAIALTALPGARAEVDDITRVWNASQPGDAATRLVGAEATERAFKEDAPGRRVLHLATHGIFWDNRCTPVYEGTRGVGGVAPIASPAGAAPAHPGGNASAASPPRAAMPPPSPWSGRRVWLALAGANRSSRAGADENDGLLTADEVVTLDLSDVEWVVLSACQSGLGQSWPLEGSVGMRRAFRLAGARAVIASQWSIADEATREWMRALYAARAAGRTSAGDAIRSADRSVLELRRRQGRTTHPFYWAAFSTSGS